MFGGFGFGSLVSKHVKLGLLLATTALSLGVCEYLQAGLARNSSVGGVAISTNGIVSAVTVEAQQKLRTAREKMLRQVPGDLKPFSELRKISLKRLEAAIRSHQTTGSPLSEELIHLAGLQHIQYIFVYPEQNDIVLAGPAEGWMIDPLGNAVGQTTGQPVMLLDDLLAALRHVANAQQAGFSCSIDPTPEGMQNLRQLAAGLRSIGNPRQTAARIENALGPQQVTIGGIPATTHFARIMLAADFRMKRLAMHFDEAPVAGLPSFMQLAKASGRGLNNMLPRWWLAPQAEPLLADPNGLAWELREIGVQCMTETDFLDEAGERQQGAGQANQAANRWAQLFTEKYPELALKDTVFGQLRNLVELSVAAAILDRHQLFQQANLKVPYLLGEQALDKYDAPTQIHSQASLLKKGRRWLISASGGVEIFPHDLTDKVVKADTMRPLRAQTTPIGERWWWD